MNCKKSFLSRLTTMATLFTLTGVVSAFGAEAPAAKPAAAPSPTAVVAKVDGVDITRGDVDQATKILLQQNRMPQQLDEETAKKVEEAALNQLIAKELLYQAGKKLEIKDLDKQVAERIAQGKARFPSAADYDKMLKDVSMTDKDVETFTREELVIDNLIDKNIASKVTVSDAEAKKFYDDNIDKFKRGEMVRASHILIGVDKNATPEAKKQAKEKAEAILKKLKGGADFAELAKDDSTCPSKARGGDLGFFGRGQMVPEFEKAAFALKPGELSDVVETQFGYHIIKLTEKKAPETAKFDDVKERIDQYLKQQKTQEAIQKYIEELRGKAKVEILTP